MSQSAPHPLCARHLSVSLGGRAIVREVDLTLHRGEVVALVGPNGAGKSTLLAALAGDLCPSGGQVELAGAPLASLSSIRRARLRAVHLQQHAVSFAYTVREVVEMGRTPWAAGPDAGPAVERAMAATDVEHLAGRPVPTLSGGEQARVALARAFAQTTPLLLLDEPTAALDLGHQERILAEVRRRTAAGGAALIVVHDLRLAASYADRIALLVDGRIETIGEPGDVLRADIVSAAYRYPVSVCRMAGQLHVIPQRASCAVPVSPGARR